MTTLANGSSKSPSLAPLPLGIYPTRGGAATGQALHDLRHRRAGELLGSRGQAMIESWTLVFSIAVGTSYPLVKQDRGVPGSPRLPGGGSTV
jgi:hypothetical protein